MDFINPLANDYTEKYSNATPSYLKSLFEETLTSHQHAHLQSSWTQGGFLSFLSKLLAPTHILEIGTFTGFSALCLAEGLANNGELHTIELRAEDAQKAQAAFNNSPKVNQIKLHTGDAKLIIPTLLKKWDLVFIDADKTGYIEYYNLVMPQLNTNGIIIVDNVLFHGEVLEDSLQGKSAKAIQAFNEHVLSDQNTEQVMLTIRDGLTLIRKK
ncbi:MAG: O-methyltransferase [Bacteroidetes bacterium]|nr:O-methyltransferase [Bacteroidota bacterium]